jgi:hypothetical protein
MRKRSSFFVARFSSASVADVDCCTTMEIRDGLKAVCWKAVTVEATAMNTTAEEANLMISNFYSMVVSGVSVS